MKRGRGNQESPPPGESASGFEAEFNRVRQVETNDGLVEYVDLRPPGWQSRPTLLFTGGWSVGRDSCRDLGQTFYNRQRRSLLVDFTSMKRDSTDRRDPYFEIVAKANGLIKVINDAETGPVDAIAHSEGVLATTYAARYHTEQFNNLILAMLAGMIGKDSFAALLARFVPKMAYGLTKEISDNTNVGLSLHRGETRHLLRHPTRSLREIRAMAKTPISDSLADLRASQNPTTGRRIRVGVLQAHRDLLFPPDFIEDHVRIDSPWGRDNVDGYASFITKSAGHDDIYVNPNRAAGAALDMLDSFADLRS